MVQETPEKKCRLRYTRFPYSGSPEEEIIHDFSIEDIEEIKETATQEVVAEENKGFVVKNALIEKLTPEGWKQVAKMVKVPSW